MTDTRLFSTGSYCCSGCTARQYLLIIIMERIVLGMSSDLSILAEMLTPQCKKNPIRLPSRQFRRRVRALQKHTHVVVAKIDPYLQTITRLEKHAAVTSPNDISFISFEEPIVKNVIGERNPTTYCVRLPDFGRGIQILHGDVDGHHNIVTKGFRINAGNPPFFAISGAAIAVAYVCIQDATTEELFVQAVPIDAIHITVLRSIVEFTKKKSVAKTLIKYSRVQPDPFEHTVKEVIPLDTGNYCAACSTKGIRLHVCSRCQSVKYCDRDCQKRHWGTHKLVCSTSAVY
jgi:MYND finger